jgi:hypothetical protein
MAMTKQQKQEQTRRLAKRMFTKWSAEGGRFYKHDNTLLSADQQWNRMAG